MTKVDNEILIVTRRENTKTLQPQRSPAGAPGFYTDLSIFKKEILHTKPPCEVRRFGVYEKTGQHTNKYVCTKGTREPQQPVQASVDPSTKSNQWSQTAGRKGG